MSHRRGQIPGNRKVRLKRSNVHLGLTLLEKRTSFHGVMLDRVFTNFRRRALGNVFKRLMREGAVRPLNRSVFKREEVEQAFRFMATGGHVGKVLVQVREPEDQLVVLPPTQTLNGLARLKKIQEEKMGAREDTNMKQESSSEPDPISKLSTEDLGKKPSRVIPEDDEKSTLPKAVLFPDIEGFTGVLEILSRQLSDVRTVQYAPDEQNASVAKIVESQLPIVQKLLPEGKKFLFLAYCYGALIALEMVHNLENQGYTGILICIDGALLIIKRMVNSSSVESDRMITNPICQLLSLFIPHDEIVRNEANLLQCRTWEEKVNFATELVKTYDADEACCVEKVADAIYRRCRDLDTYQPTYRYFKSDVKLFKSTFSAVRDIEDDYGLSQFFQKPVEIRYFEGNHQTVLENEKLVNAIEYKLSKYLTVCMIQ